MEAYLEEKWTNLRENAQESLPTLSNGGRNGFETLDMLILDYKVV